MLTNSTSQYLKDIILTSLPDKVSTWLEEKIQSILQKESTRELYMTYTLLAQKIDAKIEIIYPEKATETTAYLKSKNANLLEIARIYLLSKVLEEKPEFFIPKVANLIQVADTKELETLLKFLYLLPNAENFLHTATEALRSNISSVFNAIALNNPYPGRYFNDQQWNQMFLKATFIDTDLSQISDIDQKANSDLARIISDYAHERWAASRTINPLFWRPVSNFLNETLLEDMKRLLKSDDKKENYAAGLCCINSNSDKAQALLDQHPEIKNEIVQKNIDWETF